MGACVELYAEVGKTFEAIRTGARKAPGAPDCLTEVNVSFTSTIEQLEQKYTLLKQDHIRVVKACERWQAQATDNGQLKASAENELAVKKADLESAHSVIQGLRRQLQVASESLERLQQQRASSVQEINEISRMLNNVRSGLCPVAEPATV
jgi:chromosome segregation ATPase